MKKPDFVTPADLSDAGLNMLLTGQPGSGKTALIGSAANIFPNQVCILNCDGGMRTLADRSDIAVLECSKWSEINDYWEYLYESDHEFKVVGLDLISGILKLAIKQVQSEGMKTSKGQPTLEGYGVANNRFMDMIRKFRLLASEKNIHVVFTAHSTETKDEDSGIVLVRPQLTPGTLSDVLGVVDFAGFMEITSKERLLYLVGNSRIWAKARVPESWGKVPETIKSPTFEKLLEVLLRGNMNLE